MKSGPKTKWFPAEQRGNGKDFPLMPAVLTLYRISTSQKFEKAIGIKWGVSFLLEMGPNTIRNYVREDHWKEALNQCYLKLKKNPDFQKKLVGEFVKRAPKFLKFCQGVRKSNLKNKANKELWQMYERYIRLYENL